MSDPLRSIACFAIPLFNLIRHACGNRNELRAVVRELVVGGSAPSVQNIRRLAAEAGIPPADVQRFSEVTLELLLSLNDGSAARYALRPSEFAEWRQHVRNMSTSEGSDTNEAAS